MRGLAPSKSTKVRKYLPKGGHRFELGCNQPEHTTGWVSLWCKCHASPFLCIVTNKKQDSGAFNVPAVASVIRENLRDNCGADDRLSRERKHCESGVAVRGASDVSMHGLFAHSVRVGVGSLTFFFEFIASGCDMMRCLACSASLGATVVLQTWIAAVWSGCGVSIAVGDSSISTHISNLGVEPEELHNHAAEQV